MTLKDQVQRWMRWSAVPTLAAPALQSLFASMLGTGPVSPEAAVALPSTIVSAGLAGILSLVGGVSSNLFADQLSRLASSPDETQFQDVLREALAQAMINALRWASDFSGPVQTHLRTGPFEPHHLQEQFRLWRVRLTDVKADPTALRQLFPSLRHERELVEIADVDAHLKEDFDLAWEQFYDGVLENGAAPSLRVDLLGGAERLRRATVTALKCSLPAELSKLLAEDGMQRAWIAYQQRCFASILADLRFSAQLTSRMAEQLDEIDTRLRGLSEGFRREGVVGEASRDLSGKAAPTALPGIYSSVMRELPSEGARRAWFDEQFDAWYTAARRNDAPPYLLMQAGPFFGKSWLAARVVRDRLAAGEPVIYHCFRRTHGLTSPEQAYRLLSRQLLQWLARPIRAEAETLSEFLGLLGEVKVDGKLLVVIDAIDEAFGPLSEHAGAATNFLPDPHLVRHLPMLLFITSRPDLQVDWRDDPDAIRQVILPNDIGQNSELDTAFRQLIQQRANQGLAVPPAQLVPHFVDASQGLLGLATQFFLRASPDRWAEWSANVTAIPLGLSRVLLSHWQSVLTVARRRCVSKDAVRYVTTILACARTPLTVRQLLFVLRLADRPTLNAMRPPDFLTDTFVNQLELIVELNEGALHSSRVGDERAYEFCHTAFAELLRGEIIGADADSLPLEHQRSFVHHLLGEVAACEWGKGSLLCGYAVTWGPEHLCDLGRLEDLVALARSEEWQSVALGVDPERPDLGLAGLRIAMDQCASAVEGARLGSYLDMLLCHSRRHLVLLQETPMQALERLGPTSGLNRALRLLTEIHHPIERAYRVLTATLWLHQHGFSTTAEQLLKSSEFEGCPADRRVDDGLNLLLRWIVGAFPRAGLRLAEQYLLLHEVLDAAAASSGAVSAELLQLARKMAGSGAVDPLTQSLLRFEDPQGLDSLAQQQAAKLAAQARYFHSVWRSTGAEEDLEQLRHSIERLPIAERVNGYLSLLRFQANAEDVERARQLSDQLDIVGAGARDNAWLICSLIVFTRHLPAAVRQLGMNERCPPKLFVPIAHSFIRLGETGQAVRMLDWITDARDRAAMTRSIACELIDCGHESDAQTLIECQQGSELADIRLHLAFRAVARGDLESAISVGKELADNWHPLGESFWEAVIDQATGEALADVTNHILSNPFADTLKRHLLNVHLRCGHHEIVLQLVDSMYRATEKVDACLMLARQGFGAPLFHKAQAIAQAYLNANLLESHGLILQVAAESGDPLHFDRGYQSHDTRMGDSGLEQLANALAYLPHHRGTAIDLCSRLNDPTKAVLTLLHIATLDLASVDLDRVRDLAKKSPTQNLCLDAMVRTMLKLNRVDLARTFARDVKGSYAIFDVSLEIMLHEVAAGRDSCAQEAAERAVASGLFEEAVVRPVLEELLRGDQCDLRSLFVHINRDESQYLRGCLEQFVLKQCCARAPMTTVFEVYEAVDPQAARAARETFPSIGDEATECRIRQLIAGIETQSNVLERGEIRLVAALARFGDVKRARDLLSRSVEAEDQARMCLSLAMATGDLQDFEQARLSSLRAFRRNSWASSWPVIEDWVKLANRRPREVQACAKQMLTDIRSRDRIAILMYEAQVVIVVVTLAALADPTLSVASVLNNHLESVARDTSGDGQGHIR